MRDSDASEAENRPSRLARAVADAALVGVGWRLGGPGGAMLAAGATPWAEDLADRAFGEFRADARRRVGDMLESAAEELGCDDPDQFGEMIGKSERTRLLTATAMDGAVKTAWPPRVAAIGRALAAGLIAKDDAVIDVEQMALGAMADMDAPHVSLLELLVCWTPAPRFTGLKVVKYEPPPVHPVERPGWHTEGRSWTIWEMGEARPPLRPVLTSLIGTLQRHGLAIENDNTAQALEKFSKANAQDVRRRTMRGGGGQPTTPAMPRGLSHAELGSVTPRATWSPTELGERVLSYYRLAATEQGEAG